MWLREYRCGQGRDGGEEDQFFSHYPHLTANQRGGSLQLPALAGFFAFRLPDQARLPTAMKGFGWPDSSQIFPQFSAIVVNGNSG
jgi:hypothetical protein